MLSHAEVIWTKYPELENVPTLATAEVLDMYVPTYGIDDARALKVHAYQTAVSPQLGRLFIIRIESITIEAQQALLKLLEEPPLGVRVVLVVRHGVALLPTVLSRCSTRIIEAAHVSDVFEAFLTQSYAERLATIEARHAKKDTQWFTVFQAGVGEWLVHADRSIEELTKQRIYAAFTLLGTRGASNKLLSEHIALSIPVSRR